MASQSTNKGRSEIHSFVIEVPVEKVGLLIGKKHATIDTIQHSSGASIKIESRPCFVGTKRRVELRGTRKQIESAIGLITGLLIDWHPSTWVESIPDHYLPEHSYHGDSSTQSSIWAPAPSLSRRQVAPWPGSLFIHPSDLGNHPIYPVAPYRANPSSWHPAVPPPGSSSDLGNHSTQPAAEYQANRSAMPPAPWPGSDLPSSSSADYRYQANPSAMPATSQPETCPAPLHHASHVVHHKYPISPGFYYQAKETIMRPASQPGTYPIPLSDTTVNAPPHATAQSQATTSGMTPESLQAIYPAPPLHHRNPFQSEVGDEAH